MVSGQRAAPLRVRECGASMGHLLRQSAARRARVVLSRIAGGRLAVRAAQLDAYAATVARLLRPGGLALNNVRTSSLRRGPPGSEPRENAIAPLSGVSSRLPRLEWPETANLTISKSRLEVDGENRL